MSGTIGYNKERAKAVMENYNLDMLIAATPINVYYLSGLPVLHSAQNPILLALNNQYPNIAMIYRDGDGTAVHWNVFVSADRFTWMTDQIGIESVAGVQDAVKARIESKGLKGKRVGVESTCPKFLYDAVLAMGVEIVECDEAFRDMRLVKSDAEAEYLEKAALITETALEDAIKAVKVGVTDIELLEIGKKSMIMNGADDWDHLTMTIGDSDPEAPGTGREVKEGEIVRLDFGAIYKGYVADVNQHVCVGEIPKQAAEQVRRCLEFQGYLEKRIAPGVNMKALGEEAVAWFKGKYPDSMAFLIGHSIGLQCEDQHIFGAFGAVDAPFEPNMVFEIEAWESFGGALVGVEDAYVVTKDGCRKMTRMAKTIIQK
jgi:Xaa-Pro dipeptidase